MLEPKVAPPPLREVTDLSGITFKYTPPIMPGIIVPWSALMPNQPDRPSGDCQFSVLRFFNTPTIPYGKTSYMHPHPIVAHQEESIARPYSVLATYEGEGGRFFWIPELIVVTFVDLDTTDNSEYLKQVRDANVMSAWEQRAALVLLMSGLVAKKNLSKLKKIHYAERKERINNRHLYSSRGNATNPRFFTSMGYFIFEEK